MSLETKTFLISLILSLCLIYTCATMARVAEHIDDRLDSIEHKITPNRFRHQRWTNSGYVWLTDSIDGAIKKSCLMQNMSPGLIRAQIEYESGRACGGNLDCMKRVKSHAGAIGIMQIMPIHAREARIPLKSLEDPEINIKLGIAILADMIKIAKHRGYKNTIAEGLRMYNQGASTWKRDYLRRHHYGNWSNYVFPILSRAGEVQLCKR